VKTQRINAVQMPRQTIREIAVDWAPPSAPSATTALVKYNVKLAKVESAIWRQLASVRTEVKAKASKAYGWTDGKLASDLRRGASVLPLVATMQWRRTAVALAWYAAGTFLR